MGPPVSSPVKRITLRALLAASLVLGALEIANYVDQPLTDQDETIGAAPAEPARPPAAAPAVPPTTAASAAGSTTVAQAPDLEEAPQAQEGPTLPLLDRESFGHRAGLHKVKADINLSASAALVIDQETGQVLLHKNGQSVLPIASLTKLMTALVISEAALPMDQVITITDDDVDEERHSRSRLRVGSSLTRSEALQLALMSSENRAAHALGRTWPGGLQAFVQAMNRRAAALGMTSTTYVDPTGLATRNQSTAHDLALLAAEAAKHQLLAAYSTTPQHLLSMPSGRSLVYNNSNRLVKSPNWEILLQKTGYIVEAGWCMLLDTRIAGHKLFVVLLDAGGAAGRLGDAERIRHWAAAQLGLPVHDGALARVRSKR